MASESMPGGTPAQQRSSKEGGIADDPSAGAALGEQIEIHLTDLHLAIDQVRAICTAAQAYSEAEGVDAFVLPNLFASIDSVLDVTDGDRLHASIHAVRALVKQHDQANGKEAAHG